MVQTPGDYEVTVTLENCDNYQVIGPVPVTLGAFRMFVAEPSLGEEGEIEDFRIYPNPSSGKFTLEIPLGELPESISVMDLRGRQVFTSDQPETVSTLDLGEFGKGMYMVTLTYPESVKQKKVIVQ